MKDDEKKEKKKINGLVSMSGMSRKMRKKQDYRIKQVLVQKNAAASVPEPPKSCTLPEEWPYDSLYFQGRLKFLNI